MTLLRGAQTTAISLALSFFIAAPVMAEVPVPTLDRVKSEQKNFLNNSHQSYALTQLTDDATAPDGAITVKIGDNTYYYTPSENTEVLKSLASTGSVALEETTDQSNALYSTPDGKYYTYDPSKLKDSAYTLTEAASADEPNTITLYDKTEVIKYYDPTTGEEVAEADRQEGVEYKEVTTIETTPKYYTVSLKQTEYGDKTADSAKPVYFKWTTDADGNKEFTQESASADDYSIAYYMQTEYGDKNAANAVAHYYKWTNDGTGNKLESTTEAAEANITYWADQTRTAPSRITSNQNGADINKDFIDKSITSSRSSVFGGAIYNYATSSNSSIIGNITGDFIGNYAYISDSFSAGGAIYNSGTIGDITGNFIGNYDYSNYSFCYASGGAVYNYATSSNSSIIGNITGDFIGNYAYAAGRSYSDSRSSASGGAIYNYAVYSNSHQTSATIGDITGDFIGNYVSVSGGGSSGRYSTANGGAIYNGADSYTSSTIGNITGDFIGNYASSSSSRSKAYGGVIYNASGYSAPSTIGDITGDFIGNYASADSEGYGGTIYNDGTIGDIAGDFIGNYAAASSYDAEGGAIYNQGGTIEDITGDFIANYVSGGRYAYGGAIYSGEYGTIGNIIGDFIGNYASASNSTSTYAYGGAIYNEKTIGDITGDFIGNYASASSSSTSSSARGGAIYNDGTIGDIIGDFIGNYASASSNTTSASAQGGAIYNYATIEGIYGDFIGNYVSAASNGTYASAYGGAIFREDRNNDRDKIEQIIGGFIGNNVSASSSGTYASAQGGAIYTNGNRDIAIEDITGDFIENNVSASSSGTYASAYGGAISNSKRIGNITGDFIGNYAEVEYTGTSSTSNNSALGGAIYNAQGSSYGNTTIGLTNTNFLNNYAKVTTSAGNAYAKGGAIFTNYDMTLNADNGKVLISGNYTETNGTKDSNAIYVANKANSSGTIQRNTTFTLNAIKNGNIQIDDKIAGGTYYNSSSTPQFWENSDHAYTLSLTGDGTGTISLYNDVENAKVTAENVTVDFANGKTHTYDLVSMTDNGNTKYNIDLDLAAGTSDKITTVNASSGTLTINNINFKDGITSSDKDVVIQVIDNADTSSTLQLAFDSKYDNIIVTDVLSTLTDSVSNTDKFHQDEGFALGTTDTINDSIKYLVEADYDTLDLITTRESNNERNFNFVDNTTYIVSKDLGPTTSGTLNINGQETGSTINANNHTLFNLANDTDLNLKNVTVEGAKDYVVNATNENATVNLTNTSIKNTTGTGIISNVDVNVTADGKNVEFTNNSVGAINMQNADKTLTLNTANNGSITLNDKVTGAAGYNVDITGSGTVNLYNQLENADVSATGATVNV